MGLLVQTAVEIKCFQACALHNGNYGASGEVFNALDMLHSSEVFNVYTHLKYTHFLKKQQILMLIVESSKEPVGPRVE